MALVDVEVPWQQQPASEKQTEICRKFLFASFFDAVSY